MEVSSHLSSFLAVVDACTGTEYLMMRLSPVVTEAYEIRGSHFDRREKYRATRLRDAGFRTAMQALREHQPRVVQALPCALANFLSNKIAM